MNFSVKRCAILTCICALALCFLGTSATAMPAFDIYKMSDMTGFDPNTYKNPEGDDVVKIGLLQIFSGPAAGNGEIFWATCTWNAYDINKRGGLMVDGKKKKVVILKGDTQGKPTTTKKEAEKLCLEEKVDVLWGTSGSHNCLVIQNVAKKYKTIFVNTLGLADTLMDGKNFNRYTFKTIQSTQMHGAALAYFYSKRPEKKFYILNQDYVYGHDMAAGFKRGLKLYKPDAVIVGETYHPLFMKDIAPYVTKITASGAEVVFSSDWLPDGGNLLKTMRELGVNLPIANIYVDEPNALTAVGIEGTKGLVNQKDFLIGFDTPESTKWLTDWNNCWKTWSKPYDSQLYKWNSGTLGQVIEDTYWLFDVMERAGSTDPEKIIATWEGDEYKAISRVRKMRACDHHAVNDTFVTEYVFPNPFFDGMAAGKDIIRIPAEYCTHPIPEDLDRCKK